MSKNFELTIWCLHHQSQEIQDWYQAVYRHDYEKIVSCWTTEIQQCQVPVDPIHLFACGHIYGGFQNSRRVLQFLLDKGFCLNAVDKNNWLPINYAVWFGLVGTTDILLELGSPCQNDMGPEPLDTALMALAQTKNQQSEECAQLLMSHGANPQKGLYSDMSFGGVSWIVWALENNNWFWANLLWEKGLRCLKEKEKYLILNRCGLDAFIWLEKHQMGVFIDMPTNHLCYSDLMVYKHNQDKKMLFNVVKSIEKEKEKEDGQGDKENDGRRGKKKI